MRITRFFDAFDPAVLTNPSILRGSCLRSIFVLIFAAFILIDSTTSALVQTPKSAAEKASVATLRNFSQKTLPRGFFNSWCGLQDRYLMEVDQQLHMFGAGTGSIVLPALGEAGIHCGRDGENVFFNGEKEFVQLDVHAGTRETIIAYQGVRPQPPRVVVSPDLKNIAVSIPLQLVSGGRRFSMLDLSPTDGNVFHIVWKSDSSKLFAVKSFSGPEYAYEGVEVFDVRQNKLGTGKLVPLPRDFIFRDGVFTEDGRELLLLLVPEAKEQEGPLTIFRCEIATSKCNPVIADIDRASLSERGIIGTVTQIPRLRKYRVEFHERVTRLFARQDFDVSERPDMDVSVAPSGNKAILRWITSEHANCWSGPTRGGGYKFCQATRLIDLSGRGK